MSRKAASKRLRPSTMPGSGSRTKKTGRPPKASATGAARAAPTGAPAKNAREPAKAATPIAATSAAGFRAKVRMYRQGLGDFFLVTLPRGQNVFRILIDCGVIVGTNNATETMKTLVAQLKRDIGNKLDVLVVTHRHADHVSGFLQAQDLFEDKDFDIGEVWVSWVENPRDALGQQLLSSHAKAEQALRLGAKQLGATDSAAADAIQSLLDFRGEALAAKGNGSTTDAAVTIAKGLAPLRYCRPDDPPQALDGTGAQVFVFGPPPDLSLLGKMDPTKSSPETYGMTAIRSLLRDIAPALGDADGNDLGAPFGARWAIPLNKKAVPAFFKDTYYDPASEWRRIDSDWLAGAGALALQFDQAVNNTSLVLAIELGAGDVLLFAADAQVGNWLSWHALSWSLPGRGTVTSSDLLKRVVFYKVGHHASHNATLEAMGLELMEKLSYAMISVNQDMALKKRWGQMPFPKLLSALDAHTGSRAVRADKDIPPAALDKVKAGVGYYELTL